MGDPILYVLHSNQPEACNNPSDNLDTYGGPPLEQVLLDLTTDTVTTVGIILSGGVRPRGTDLVSLQH